MDNEGPPTDVVPSRDRIETEIALKWVTEAWHRAVLYHNHKETMAWGALALFGVFLGGVARFVPMKESEFHLGLAASATTLVVSIGVLVHCFMRRQYCLRSWAADLCRACSALSARIAGGTRVLERTDFELSRDSRETPEQSRRWPHRAGWHEGLPVCLTTTMHALSRQDPARISLERIGFWLLWSSVILVSVLLSWPFASATVNCIMNIVRR